MESNHPNIVIVVICMYTSDKYLIIIYYVTIIVIVIILCVTSDSLSSVGQYHILQDLIHELLQHVH